MSTAILVVAASGIHHLVGILLAESTEARCLLAMHSVRTLFRSHPHGTTPYGIQIQRFSPCVLVAVLVNRSLAVLKSSSNEQATNFSSRQT